MEYTPMIFDMDLIKGLSIGFEYVDAIPEADIPQTLIVDIFFLRFMLQW